MSTRDRGAPTLMTIVAGDGQTVGAGLPVPINPAVRVTNAYGEGIAGFSVIFAIATGGGNITGASAITDAGGVATVGSWTLGAGANTLLATGSGLVGSPATITGTGASVNLDDTPLELWYRRPWRVEERAFRVPADEIPIFSAASGGDGEPVFPGVSSLWFPTNGANFYDLSAFTSVAALNAVSGNSEGIKVVTESEYAITSDYPGTTGGRSLRAIYTLGGDQQTRTIYVTPEGGTKYTPTLASVVMEMECRLTNGWTWSGDGMKFFECWFNTLPGRIQLAPTGGPPARFHIHWSQNPDGGAAAGEIAYQPMAGEPTWANAFAIGQKIVFKVRLRPNTVHGGNDGAATMWVRLASDADGTGRRVVDISAQGQADGFCTAAERTYLPWSDISYFKFPDVWNSSGSMATNADYHYFRAWKE